MLWIVECQWQERHFFVWWRHIKDSNSSYFLHHTTSFIPLAPIAWPNYDILLFYHRIPLPKIKNKGIIGLPANMLNVHPLSTTGCYRISDSFIQFITRNSYSSSFIETYLILFHWIEPSILRVVYFFLTTKIQAVRCEAANEKFFFSVRSRLSRKTRDLWGEIVKKEIEMLHKCINYLEESIE